MRKLLVVLAVVLWTGAAMAAMIDNSYKYIWSDPFGDQFDHYAEVKQGDTIRLSIFVNDLDGLSWHYDANGGQTGAWWDPAVVDWTTFSEDGDPVGGTPNYYRAHWPWIVGGASGAHFWWMRYENWGDEQWVAEGKLIISLNLTIKETAPLGLTTVGQEHGFYWGWSLFWYERIESDDPLAMTLNVLGTLELPAYLEGIELFYNGKFGNAPDPRKFFLGVGQPSQMARAGDELSGHVTNYVNGITGIRLKFATWVTFSGAVADAFSFEATPELSSDKTFSPFIPPTAPTFSQDDSSGKTVVEVTFANGEIKNRWLKTLFAGGQIGEVESAEFIIGNRLGDVDANYRCLLNDAIAIRSAVSGVLVGVSNAFDIDKNERVLLNEAIMARNAVSGVALPTLP